MPENFEYYIKNFPWVRVGTAVNWFRYITDIEPEVKRASTLSQFSIPVSFLINLNPLYRNFSNNALKYYYQLYFSYSRVFSDGLSQCFASFLIPLILWTCSDFRLNPFVSHFTFPLFFHRCVSKAYQSFHLSSWFLVTLIFVLLVPAHSLHVVSFESNRNVQFFILVLYQKRNESSSTRLFCIFSRCFHSAKINFAKLTASKITRRNILNNKIIK